MQESCIVLPDRRFLLRLALLWTLFHSNGSGDNVVEAFQNLAQQRQDYYGSVKLKKQDLSHRSTFAICQGPSTDRLSLASNGNGADDDDGDDAGVLDRLKSMLKKTYREAPSMAASNGLAESEEKSVIRRVKDVVKYPYTYLKHYFAGEKQEEVDGFNDIIVSDETIEDTKMLSNGILLDDSAVGLATAANADGLVTAAREVAEGPSPNVATTIVSSVEGDRWAVSAQNFDLSGKWNILLTDDFQKGYDKYLLLLGQPFIVRSVALTIVGMTTEETVQSDQGRSLYVRGTNARGVWERTLTASGADETKPAFTPVRTPILTIDKERVEAEAWWESRGTIHRSWLRGVAKYGGGDFESKRYLEDNGKVLVCESTFHPKDETREAARITWRFLRQGETL